MRGLAAVGLLLLVAFAAGTGPSQPTRAGAAFPGADGKIAFVSDRDGIVEMNAEIYVMNADGTSQTRLTSNPAVDSDPAWSPDGRRIAFTSNRDGDDEIYIMNADGSGQTRLTDSPAEDGVSAWSPDGSRIAFDSARDGNHEIYVMNADGSGQTRLTNNPADGGFTDWSPNGKRIAFTSERDGLFEIYVMNADGSGQTNLTNNRDGADAFPAWSPDGKRIAFVSSGDANTPLNLLYPDIYVMNADGTGRTRLTNDPALELIVDWSPDGSRIAFDSDLDGNRDIYVINADGSGQIRLTNNPAFDGAPAWSPAAGGPPPPCPPDTDCVQLTPGCQIVSLAAYAPATALSLVSEAVAPAEARPRLWFHSPRGNAFTLYDPASAERSAKTALEAGDEAAFLCVDGPATWERPALTGA